MEFYVFQQTRFSALLLGLCTIFALGLIACGEDAEVAEEWVDSWIVLGLTGDTNVEFTKNEWEFKGNGSWEAEFAFEVRADSALNITFKGSGDYSVLAEDYTITTKKFDVDFSNKIKELFNIDEKEVRQLLGGILEEPGGVTQTGTWKRRGNILTLNDSDGSVTAFQKK